MDPNLNTTQESSLSDVSVVTPAASSSATGISEKPISRSSRQHLHSQPNERSQNNGGGGGVEDDDGFSCKKFLTKRLPILKWLPLYSKTDILPDAIAGVSVALTAIPQSIAYANIAGLTPEYGLYSSFISCFVYLFLGSCRQMTIGPTAVMELLVFETCGQNFPQCVVLVGFYAGCFQFIMGLLKLGAIVSLISDPVTIGFVGGAALTIGSSQFKNFLGLSGPKGSGFLDNCKKWIENISSARLGDSLLGISCVVILLIFKNLKDYVKPSVATRSGAFLSKLLWFLSIGRNAIVVICAAALAATLPGSQFALTGKVKSGFPHIGPPQFDLPEFPKNIQEQDDGQNFDSFTFNDGSILGGSSNGTMTYWETWKELGTGPLTIALISILQNVAIAKAFGSGQTIDATQEMITLGISHIFGSFFSSMPTAGSFSRSAINEGSGVRSPIGGVFTALLVMFALSFLTTWFQYIPKATLAAVILCAVLPMIEWQSIMPMWRVSRLDVFTTVVTFLAALVLGMEYGIVIGVVTSLALYLVRPVRPRVEWSIVSTRDPDAKTSHSRSSSADFTSDANLISPTTTTTQTNVYHLIKPEQGFCFPSVDAIRTMINKLALRYPDIKVIAFDCQNLISMDYTSASALCSLVNALKKTGKSLVFVHCKPEWEQMLKSVGLAEPQCYDNIDDLINVFK
ncbi:Sodium-independent sulfate anion transporter [Orchesella cincta]|uniref:Sodium-independent sulfate anion transporter n=1 Tax=Orchesella cincta TaxID=48709 RepID=A0A1D2MYW7_ORCCI|nr:Sodium-independent sulfate anion transporter [Orchesella cincta]